MFLMESYFRSKQFNCTQIIINLIRALCLTSSSLVSEIWFLHEVSKNCQSARVVKNKAKTVKYSV